MNANIRNSMLKITMDDGTEIMGRVESLTMTRPIYDSPLDDIHPQPICNQMVCVFDMFLVNAPKAEEAPPFDLEVICRKALRRVTADIASNAGALSENVMWGFSEAIELSDLRHRQHWRDIYPYHVTPESLRPL